MTGECSLSSNAILKLLAFAASVCGACALLGVPRTAPLLKIAGTRRRMPTELAQQIVGVNKYSHDTSCSIIDLNGNCLYTQAKERITGRKHDGGNVDDVMAHGFANLGMEEVPRIPLTVHNNHHFRVNPFEKRLLWNEAMRYVPSDYSDHVFLDSQRAELSHHLAHAWAAVGTAPFDKGLILVMDGMGESYKAMIEDLNGAENQSGDYIHDLKLLAHKPFNSATSTAQECIMQPSELLPGSTYREAESAYLFDRTKGTLHPVFKRWSRERSPSELYNHGFENMESMGAVYSRISAHITGDWNACGKVMGLAPWAGRSATEAEGWFFSGDGNSGDKLNMQAGKRWNLQDPYTSFMTGNPYDRTFAVNWEALESLPDPNEWRPDRVGELAAIAQRVQTDLESCALQLCHSLRQATKAENIVLTGGVALNSVLNSRIRREGGFKQVFVPSAPGDEGIAMGCALYGLQRYHIAEAAALKLCDGRYDRPLNDDAGHIGCGIAAHGYDPDSTTTSATTSVSASANSEYSTPPLSKPTSPQPRPIKPLTSSPYLGSTYTDADIDEEAEFDAPWLEKVVFPSDVEVVEDAAQQIADGHVVAWFQGKSEFGQRALGARSLLADPRKVALRQKLNRDIKQREWYRPLAPSVLDEHVGEWFEDLQSGQNASPYMSFTATVRADKQALVPAVCHVDGTARLQTVALHNDDEAALYHQLISAFFRRTGAPMVLNTSFNRKGMPIVETPQQAISAFVKCAGDVSYLYMGKRRFALKPFPLTGGKSKEPGAADKATAIAGRTVYRSEVSLDMSGLVKVARIDCGDGQFVQLPSGVHLSLMQVLQNHAGLTVGTLLERVEAKYNRERGECREDKRWRFDKPKRSWRVYRDALRWLYHNMLVHFPEAEA